MRWCSNTKGCQKYVLWTKTGTPTDQIQLNGLCNIGKAFFMYVFFVWLVNNSLQSVFTHTQWSETVKVCSHAKVFFVESADWMKVKKPRNTVDGALIFSRIQNHNLFVFLYIYICWGDFLSKGYCAVILLVWSLCA